MSYQIGDQGPTIVAFGEWLNRKFKSYAGIKVDGKYGLDEARVVAEAMRRYQLPPSYWKGDIGGKMVSVEGGIATDEFLRRALYSAPAQRHKFEIQGVGGDSTAFLNPPQAHSFQRATMDFAIEGNRLTPLIKPPIIPIGYSMGGVSVCKYLNTLAPVQRSLIGAVFTFGDPSEPDSGSLVAGDYPGHGISNLPQPDWCHDRYYSYALPGDWYPQARGLLFFLYDVLTRAELTPDFAMYLFTQFPFQAMQELMGLKKSTDTTGVAGILAPLAGLITSGPASIIGNLLGPAQILMLLPEVVELLFDAIQFITTNAHGMYGDPGHAVFDGMTGVDHAVATIKKLFPGGATTLLFPGTWSNWDQLFQYDVAIRLYNEG